jgi:hypothetical protein
MRRKYLIWAAVLVALAVIGYLIWLAIYVATRVDTPV